ncbi:nuclear transport factor 2 family protein [Algibacter pectinivorans]|uniref:SnoaL-like domain-containing protein n=1 Tax=Algibacter pectinivorans TaxID=870482 RepID=A0A1I1SCF7_9FLAO|nr:nuclear transport factor 2 family protein [Algibacter pectinivorans]SFD40690.1 SnoaL-like domain-containing protein [Algibacter pectinivorans]
MKKLFLLGLALYLFVACQDKQQTRYFESSPEIETFKANIKAYESQDWETWKANYADTAKIYHNANKQASPEETMNGMIQTLSNFSEYKLLDDATEIEMIIDKEGNTWVNYWNGWAAKAKVTGKTITVPIHITAQFIDGKIVNEYAYYDTSSMRATIAEVKEALESSTTTE